MECDRCNKEFPAGSLRVDRKGKRLVCEECHTYITTGTFVPEKTKAEAKQKYEEKRRKLTMSTEERLDKLGEKKEQYVCKACNYRFSSIRNYSKKCPYCGEGSVIRYSPEVTLKEINEFV